MNTIELNGETLNLEDLSSLTAWLRQHISVTRAQVIDNEAEPPAGVEITFRFDIPLDGWINDGDLIENITTMTVLSDLAEEPQKAQNKTIPFPVMAAARTLTPEAMELSLLSVELHLDRIAEELDS